MTGGSGWGVDKELATVMLELARELRRELGFPEKLKAEKRLEGILERFDVAEKMAKQAMGK